MSLVQGAKCTIFLHSGYLFAGYYQQVKARDSLDLPAHPQNSNSVQLQRWCEYLFSCSFVDLVAVFHWLGQAQLFLSGFQ